MNNLQTEILIGSLLGDGTLRKKNRGFKDNCTFVKNQCKKDKDGNDKIDYMKWHFDSFSPYSSSIGIVKKRKAQNQYEFRTGANVVFTELEKKWYIPSDKKRIKIIPSDVKLTPLSLCVWFMDDGSRSRARQTQTPTQQQHVYLVLEEVLYRNQLPPTRYYMLWLGVCCWVARATEHKLQPP